MIILLPKSFLSLSCSNPPSRDSSSSVFVHRIQAMAEGFARWESDPLFSAAEVVQDSADRMESAFRVLLHEQSLARRDPLDSRLLTSVNYHTRDLATTLETTKWQLEDFEGAVHFAALSDNSNSRENAILRYRQFIRAIREQILQFEKSVEGLSTNDYNKDSQWINSNEQDTNGLALFLSGGDSRDNNLHYGSGSSIMRRFLDSATNSDEIVELKPEDVEPLPMNGPKHSYHGYDSLKDHESRNADSNYSKIYDAEAPYASQDHSGLKECEESCAASGAYVLGRGGSGAKCYSYMNRLLESVWSYLVKVLLVSESKESFTKRRKDGEVTDNLDHDNQWMPSSAANIPPAEKNKCIRKLSTCVSRTYQGLNLESTLLYHWLQRRIQRCWYLIKDNRFSKRLASVVLIILILLGLIALYAAR